MALGKPKQRNNAGSANPRKLQKDVTIAKWAIPSTANVAATKSRKMKSAAPGAAVGNIENSLCTVEGYSRGTGRAIPKEGSANYPLVAA
jgi:hypothetical protein